MLLLIWSAVMYFFIINLVVVTILNWKINKEWMFPSGGTRSEQSSTMSNKA